MIPTKCPVSRAFTSYVSLLIINISINTLKESTSYFPEEYIYLNNSINYLEIQPNNLTDDFTPYDENKAHSYRNLNKDSQVGLAHSDSRTLDSGWCI